LSRDGGALPKILEPPVAAPIGSGDQYMSTIHIDDLVNIFQFAIENISLNGTYNAVGPEPSTNREFTQLAAKAADKIYVPIAVPGFLLKIALGEMSQIVLGGNKVTSDKLIETGFKFQFSSVKAALDNLFTTK
jgi:NAD dependent epimerase/dehydratase family enzyme